MKKLRNYIVFILLLMGASPIFSQDFVRPKKDLYLRVQPLYILSHNTFMFELEYNLSEAYSVSTDFFYTGYVHSAPEKICFICLLTNNADSRLMYTLNFKYYLPILNRALYISPYARLRSWTGELDHFYNSTTPQTPNSEVLNSTGLAVGGTIGARETISKKIDLTLYFGGGGYIYESATTPKGYEIDSFVKTDYRFGINIGFRLN